MSNVTTLGQHISLVRPTRVIRHTASGAWKQAKTSGRKTRKLTMEMKQVIAREMGYGMREVAR